MASFRATLSKASDFAHVALRCWPRYAVLRMRGYASANPYFRSYQSFPGANVAGTIREIMAKAGLRQFGTIIDLGCGTGRNVRALRQVARQIHGVDIIDAAMVSGVDNYLRIIPGDSNCLAPIPAASIEAVFVLFYYGFQPHSKWRSYVSHNDRLEAYLEPQNFLRVIRSGGYLIFCEWEAEPEKRWGKASLSTIDQRASVEYDPPKMAGFELVRCGFAKATRSPFVVYRRT